METVHVAIVGTYIYYGRQSSAITCRKAAFVEIHVLYNIGIERRKHAESVICVI